MADTMNLRNSLALSLALAASLSACDRQAAAPGPAAPAAAPAPVADAPPPPAPVAAAPVITPDSPIWFEPAAISECSKGEVLTVHWNASGLSGVKTVEVSVAGKEGAETLFATAGVVQQKTTGPWALAGTEFVLRDAATKDELQRTKVPGAPCDAPATETTPAPAATP
jgi:hypothetical protein